MKSSIELMTSRLRSLLALSRTRAPGDLALQPVLSKQHVIAVRAAQVVAVPAAGKLVVADVADQDVGAAFAENDVVAALSSRPVVTFAAARLVVGCTAEELVVPGVSVQCVGRISTLELVSIRAPEEVVDVGATV